MKIVGALLSLAFAVLLMASWNGWYGFSLDKNINPVALANLLIGAFIAFFLQSYLSNTRAEKDLLISGVKEAFAALRACREEFLRCVDAKCPPDSSKILGLLRSLANEIQTLDSALNQSRCSGLKRSFYLLVQEEYLAYKSAITAAPFPAEAYQRGVVADHGKYFRRLQQNLQNLLFKINRHR